MMLLTSSSCRLSFLAHLSLLRWWYYSKAIAKVPEFKGGDLWVWLITEPLTPAHSPTKGPGSRSPHLPSVPGILLQPRHKALPLRRISGMRMIGVNGMGMLREKKKTQRTAVCIKSLPSCLCLKFLKINRIKYKSRWLKGLFRNS